MIKHIVSLDFSGIPAELEPKLLEAMLGLIAIPDMKAITAGRNVSERDKTYTHAMSQDFEDMEAVGRYLVHPIHEQFLTDFVKPYCKTRAIVDYEF